MKIRWLGRVKYEDALALQNELVAEKADGPDLVDQLLLLEHDSVFTIGRTRDQSSLRDLALLSAPCVVTNRGGQATWHGPGQLVGYPILDLRRRAADLHRYLRDLEDVVIAICARVGVATQRKEDLTGVWVGDRKIASIGVGVRRWITMHGFALNVCGALEGFDHIIPCGISGVKMTSLEREGAAGVTVEKVAQLAADVFPAMFDGIASAQPSVRAGE